MINGNELVEWLLGNRKKGPFTTIGENLPYVNPPLGFGPQCDCLTQGEHDRHSFLDRSDRDFEALKDERATKNYKDDR